MGYGCSCLPNRVFSGNFFFKTRVRIAVLLVCLSIWGPLSATFAGSSDVATIILPDFPAPEIAALADRLYAVLQKQAHYLLGQLQPWNGDERYKLLTESKSQEHWIRPNTGAVQSLCFLYRFGPYDEKTVGLSREELLRQAIIPMIRYLTETHVTGTRPTGDGKRWGDAWQSAHWAQMLGRGAWWIFDDLPEELQTAVRRVVRHEAERIARGDPPSQLRRDTKAEENAWNAQILSVAMLLMPHDERAAEWHRQFQRWTLSAFLRPADQGSTAMVDGRPLAEQFTGANIFDDFTLENHGFVHPDYMGTFTLSLGCATDFRMTGRKEPESVYWNVAGIYENLKWFILPDMGFVYPSGQDWTIFRQPAWITRHVLMFVYGRDPEAWDLLQQSVTVTERMQQRSPVGAIYDSSQYFFPSTQTDIASALARAWLDLHFASPQAMGEYHPRLGVRHLEFGKIVLHRTPEVVFALSYGPIVMGTVTRNRPDRVTSPDQRSLFGHVILAGEKNALPVRLQTAEVTTEDDVFLARLMLHHGDAVRSEWTIKSFADGRLQVSEELVAMRPCTTEEVATGLIGILNNVNWIYETGQRVLTFDDQQLTVAAHSGMQVERAGIRHILIDHALTIDLSPDRTIVYRGATGPERGRATDRLYLNAETKEHRYDADDVLAQWSATISASRQ
jgi:hypothetical protein